MKDPTPRTEAKIAEAQKFVAPLLAEAIRDIFKKAPKSMETVAALTRELASAQTTATMLAVWDDEDSDNHKEEFTKWAGELAALLCQVSVAGSMASSCRLRGRSETPTRTVSVVALGFDVIRFALAPLNKDSSMAVIDEIASEISSLAMATASRTLSERTPPIHMSEQRVEQVGKRLRERIFDMVSETIASEIVAQSEKN